MAKIKKLFIDFETTGLDEKIHGSHQLSGMIEIDGVIVEKFDYKFRPFDGCEFSDKALEITNLSKQELLDRDMSENDVYLDLLKMFDKYCLKFNKKDKFILYGYNVSFDKNFLNALWLRQNDSFLFSYIHGMSVDVGAIAIFAFESELDTIENLQLFSVCGLAGIEIDKSKLHDSSYDIEITRELFFKSKEKLLGNSSVNLNVNSSKNILNLGSILSFGKYTGKTIQNILLTDAQYLNWINTNNIKNISFDDEVLAKISENMILQQNTSSNKLKPYKTKEIDSTEYVESLQDDDLPF